MYNNNKGRRNVFAGVLPCRNLQQTKAEVTNMSVAAKGAKSNDGPAAYSVSEYDELLEEMTGYESPTIGDDVGCSSTKRSATAYASLDDDPRYTSLAQSPSDNNVRNIKRKPSADARYLELLDYEYTLSNRPEVPPPRGRNNTQVPPADTM